MTARVFLVICLAVPVAAQDAAPGEVLRQRIVRGICGEMCAKVRTVAVRSVVTQRGPGDEVSRHEERSVYAFGRPVVHDSDYVPQFNGFGSRTIAQGITRVVIMNSGERKGVERMIIPMPVLIPLMLGDPGVTPAVDIRLASTAEDGAVTLELKHDQWVERWQLDSMDRVVRIERPNGRFFAYSDFRQVNGVWWPFRRESASAVGGTEVAIVQSVEVNGAIPADVLEASIEGR